MIRERHVAVGESENTRLLSEHHSAADPIKVAPVRYSVPSSSTQISRRLRWGAILLGMALAWACLARKQVSIGPWCTPYMQSEYAVLCHVPLRVLAVEVLLRVLALVAVALAFAVLSERVAHIQLVRVKLRLLVATGVLSMVSLALLRNAWIGSEIWPYATFQRPMIELCMAIGWIGLGRPVETTTSQPTFIDVGARKFDSSTQWFLDHYPNSNDFSLVAFEVEPRFAVIFQAEHPEVEVINKAVGASDGTIKMRFGMAHRVEDSASGSGVHEVPVIDFALFLQLRFVPENLVVVKIDVEGSELDLFEHLIATGAIGLIDEVFVEWHSWFVPAKARRMSAILAELSRRGIPHHFWL